MLRFTTIFTGRPGTPGYSTMYTGGDTSGEADIGGNYIGVFWDALKVYQASGLIITISGDVERVDPATGQIIELFTFEDNIVNSTGSGPIPPADQGLMRWRTGDFINGREVRGRTFIPYLSSSAETNGVPSSAFVAAAQDAADDLLVGLGAAGDMCVYSPTHGQFANVTSHSVWNQFAVLRSRRD